jgi:arylsulfatase A-like enzyme
MVGMMGGKPSPSSGVSRLVAQLAVVVAVLVAAKVWLVWRIADVAPTSPRVLVALSQDLLFALALGVLLAAAALAGRGPLRLAGETAVMLAMVANSLIVVIASEVSGLFTVEADTPKTWGALAAVLADYGSVPRLVAMLFIAAALWLVPALVARKALLRWVVPVFVMMGPLVISASILGTASASSTYVDDAVEVGSLRDNPLIHYVASAFGERGFSSFRGEPPAGFDDIGRTLAPLAGEAEGLEAVAPLEELSDRRFNVVLVVLESVGMTAFDFDAPASDRHPFLSRMRDQATRFTRYSSPAPHSATSLTAIACSQLRLPIGLDRGGETALGHCRPVARLLEAGGVRTGFFQSAFVGDWIEGSFFERLRFGVNKDASAVIAERRASGRPVDERGGILQEHETVSELLGWIEERCARREPFFGVYYSWVAHAPYPADHGSEHPFSPALAPRERHRGLVRTLDAQIERLHDALAGSECGRPAVLLVTGDHGEAFEEHPGNRYHVMHVYEENVRVPLVAIAPGLTGRRVDAVASHLDLAPTIVDLTLGREALAGTEAPESGELPGRPYQGRSLLRRAASRPAFSVSLQGEGRASIRFGRYKLISSPRTSWLFDTDADPNERLDLTARQPDLARALRGAFGGWVAYQLAYQGRS